MQLYSFSFVALIGFLTGHWIVVVLALAVLACEGLLWLQRRYAAFFAAVCTRTVAIQTKEKNLFVRSRWSWNSQTTIEELIAKPFNPPDLSIDGNVTCVELAHEHTFHYTTNSSGFRCTQSQEVHEDSRPIIAVFGCSITFGTAVSDEDTYCWKLQAMFPQYRVCNYAIQGFSPYESLLLMKQALSTCKPAAVVFGYHPVQDIRNVRSYPYTWWMGEQPQCELVTRKHSSRSELREAKRYQLPWSFGAAPTVPLLLLFCYLQSPLLRRNRQSTIRATMEHIFLEMKELCGSVDCPLLIAALDSSVPYVRFFEQHEFAWCRSLVSLDEKSEEGKYAWTLYPFDLHPNGAAHGVFAKDIDKALSALFRGLHYSPPGDSERLDSQAPVSRRSEFSYPLY